MVDPQDVAEFVYRQNPLEMYHISEISEISEISYVYDHMIFCQIVGYNCTVSIIGYLQDDRLTAVLLRCWGFWGNHGEP